MLLAARVRTRRWRGCESFDPSEWFNTKKPLPGDRKAVFPEGVPGVPQGVPPDLVQGYQPPPEPVPEPQVVEAKPKAEAETQAEAGRGAAHRDRDVAPQQQQPAPAQSQSAFPDPPPALSPPLV